MQIKRILESDVIPKIMALYPDTQRDHQGNIMMDHIRRGMDAANVFGALTMNILVDLTPVELMYLVETNHKIKATPDGWEVELGLVEIAYHTPDIMIMMAYNGVDLQTIYTDPGVLTMLGNSLSGEAQQRFNTNGFINNYNPRQIPMFEGWELLNIGLDTFDEYIAPVNPVTAYQIASQQNFEKALRNEVGALHVDDEFELEFTSVFAKHVTFLEFVKLVRTENLEIINICYGLRQLIKAGYIPQNLYTKNINNNVLGNPVESLDCNLEAIERLMVEGGCWFMVVVKNHTTYKINEELKYVDLDERNPFDRYLRIVMDSNIKELLPEYSWGKYVKPSVEVVENDQSVIEFPVNSDEPDDHSDDIPNQLADEVVIAPKTGIAPGEEGYNEPEEADEDRQNDDDGILRDVDNLLGELKDSVDQQVSSAEVDYPSLLEEASSAVEAIPENVFDPNESDVEPISEPTHLGDLAFFVLNGGFDAISMIEKNESYHTADTRGVVCADYVDGKPSTYYLGKPILNGVTNPIQFKWDIIDLDLAFQTDKVKNGFYQVRDWYQIDGTVVNDVRWVDYRQHPEMLIDEKK